MRLSLTAHSRPTRPHLETHALRTHSKNNNLIACECSCIAPWPDDANTDHIISVMQQQHRHVRESNGMAFEVAVGAADQRHQSQRNVR